MADNSGAAIAPTSIIATLGCGTIGASWATAFLDAGYVVQAWDPSAGALDSLAQHPRAASALRRCGSPVEAVTGAAFVQESGPEVLALKQALLNEIAPGFALDAVLASSTSTIPPTALQEDCPFADRVLVGHPFNPPHILPLVEVVGGAETALATIEAAMRFYLSLGKHPIRLHVERPGHLANRLQAALWREAVDAVATGQASVADVEAAVTLALGPRWALLGPFSTFHLAGGEGGLAHFLDHLGGVFEYLWDDASRPQLTEELTSQLVRDVQELVGQRPVAELARRRDIALRRVLEITKGDSDG